MIWRCSDEVVVVQLMNFTLTTMMAKHVMHWLTRSYGN